MKTELTFRGLVKIKAKKIIEVWRAAFPEEAHKKAAIVKFDGIEKAYLIVPEQEMAFETVNDLNFATISSSYLVAKDLSWVEYRSDDVAIERRSAF